MHEDETETLTQADLLDDLDVIFPGFREEWRGDWEETPSRSLHSVWMSLFPFALRPEPTPMQWKRLADLMSREVAAGGDRENAVDTCVLEGLNREVRRILRPLVSREAQKYV
jgi:hypothetical protein